MIVEAMFEVNHPMSTIEKPKRLTIRRIARHSFMAYAPAHHAETVTHSRVFLGIALEGQIG